MPKVVRNFETKRERQEERKRVGKPEDAIVKSVTTERYHQSFQQFLSFTNLSKVQVKSYPDMVDERLCEYIEYLWSDGEPKSYANYAVASVQHFAPECKRKLNKSWKLVSTWNKIELPAQIGRAHV